MWLLGHWGVQLGAHYSWDGMVLTHIVVPMYVALFPPALRPPPACRECAWTYMCLGDTGIIISTWVPRAYPVNWDRIRSGTIILAPIENIKTNTYT